MRLKKNIITIFSAALMLLTSGCQTNEKPMEKSETPVIDAIMRDAPSVNTRTLL